MKREAGEEADGGVETKRPKSNGSGSAARSWSDVHASRQAMQTSNPIRQIVDRMKTKPNPDKEMLKLSIGDPTVFGNLRTPDTVVEAVEEALRSFKYNGYPHSMGYEFARQAVADRYSSPGAPLTAGDVVLCSACSGAIEIALTAIANEGDNILLPNPGFSLYRTICDSKGIECRFYSLQASKEWEADLDSIRSLVDGRTKALLINNPSNPCGSVFTKEHLQDILAVADELKLPVISDEIYADMVFEGATFHPAASLTETVPVLSVGGLAKQYLVPGWRMGWILIHDRNNILSEIREGITRLTTLILGSNSVVQGALPRILKETPQSYYDTLNATLQENAHSLMQHISQIPGLVPVKPSGAMYLMVGVDLGSFPSIEDDLQFSERLLEEESVSVLPGQCFGMPNFFRIVTCPPLPVLEEACERLAAFCARHKSPDA